MSEGPDISIITPSYNMGAYLRRAAASVADQEGVRVEHIVRDGGSTDGTVQWLSGHPEIRAWSGRDGGMYDAINQGFLQARGAILGHLNCDEQYLPGTLAFVKDFFDRHPEVDLLFGNAYLVRPDGSPIAFRKGMWPSWPLILAAGQLYLFTCTMFIRRRVIEQGMLLDTSYRNVGDCEYIVRMLRNGVKARHVDRFMAAFTMTRANLSMNASAIPEKARFDATKPFWVKALRIPLNLLRLLIKLASGGYWIRTPVRYAIFGPDDTMQRRTFEARTLSSRWKED